MARQPFAFALVFIALLLSASSLLGQGTTSRVTGTVTDSAGAAVAGAAVTLTNEGTGSVLTTETSDSGSYVFDLIQPGLYTVTVEKAGFKRAQSTSNSVLVNQPATVNTALEIGDVSAIVSVEGTAEQVQTSSSGNIGNTVETRTLESLPIVGTRGRNPLDLLNYQPGVVTGANTGGAVHVNGSRDRSFNFTLDGIDINESTAGGSNFTPLRPNPESIQEFQVITSGFTAELGRSSGAQVTFVTRSGTNEFHGNLFEYYQTPEFHARSYAANVNNQAKEQFVQHIFGGSLGGPLYNPGFGEGTSPGLLKNKAFFFVNLQMLRAYDSAIVTRTVFTETARQGIFRWVRHGVNGTTSVDSNGNPRIAACTPTTPAGTQCVDSYNIATQTGGIGLDPLLMSYLRAMPLPNNYGAGGDGLNTSSFVFSSPQNEKQYDFVSKFDFVINDKNSFYVRYAQGEQNTFGDSANGGRPRFPDAPRFVDTFRTPKNLAVNWRWSPTPTFTNEFLVGLSKFGFSFDTPQPDPNYTFIFNLPTDSNTNFSYNARSSQTWQFVDNMTFDLSPHVIKAGINFRFAKATDDRASVAGTNIEPTINFSRVSAAANFPATWGLPSSAAIPGTPPPFLPVINSADLTRLQNAINDMLGRVGNYSRAFVADPSNPSVFAPEGSRWVFEATYPELDFYVQDSWRFRPNLMFDLGARLETKLHPGSAGGLPVLVPDRDVRMGAPATNAIRWTEGQVFDNDYVFMPSVGLAWDPFKNGKTSIRANYRLASDKFASFLFSSFIWQNAPGNTFRGINDGFGLLRNGIPSVVPTTSPDVLRTPPAFATGSVNVIAPDVKFPRIHNWTFSFQRELFDSFVFEFNYIGKKGVNLFGGYNANQVNIDGTLPGASGNFLDAFNRVRAGSNNDPFINLLMTGNAGNAQGTVRFRALNSTAITQGSVASLALATSQKRCEAGADVTGGLCTAAQVGQRLLALRGLDTFFQPFSQFTGGLFVVDSNDYSFYNGFEFDIKRRIKNGLGFQFGYTWSVSKDSRSFDPAFTTVATGTTQTAANTPFDNRNRRLNYSWSDFDRRHTFLGTYVWELPFGKDKWIGGNTPSVVNYIISGWQLAGGVRIMSGRPFTVFSGLNTFSDTVGSTANCNGCSRNMGSLQQLDLATPLEGGTRNWWFNAEERQQFSQPAPGEQGNTGRNYFIGPSFFETDVSLLRKFRFTERWSFDLRVDAKNVTNTPNFAAPTAVYPVSGNLTNSLFGRINADVVNNNRRIQFSGKLNF